VVGRVAILVAIANAVGCYAPAFKDCELACAAGDRCPDGYECQGLVCRPIGATMACPMPGTMIDASTDDSMLDAYVIPPHPTTAWGNVTVAVSGSMFPNGVDDVSLTGDMLEMYVTVGNRILVATRGSLTENWSAFTAAPGDVNSTNPGDLDDAPYVSTDGLTMYWMSSRLPSLGTNDIWMATRPERKQPWTSAINVSELNSAGVDSGGSVSADGLYLVMTTEVGSNSADLMYSTRALPTNRWSAPLAFQGLNLSSNDSHPVMSPDKLTIYFHSNRFAGADYELLEAHRDSPGAAFGAPTWLTELSTGGYDADPWVSPDGRTMYFTRADVGGPRQIMKATR